MLSGSESLKQDTAGQTFCSYEWIIQSLFPSYQQLFSNPQQALFKLSRNNVAFCTRPFCDTNTFLRSMVAITILLSNDSHTLSTELRTVIGR